MTDALSSVEITAMSLSDIPKIVSLIKEYGLSEWTTDGLRAEFSNENALCLVARQQSLIVGFLIARLLAHPELEILNFGVSDKHRRKGIGALLWRRMAAEARARSVEAIWLEVRESNGAAVEFYRQRGLKTIQKRKNFYTSPVEDALLMRLLIENNRV